jgi:hypothetical protein
MLSYKPVRLICVMKCKYFCQLNGLMATQDLFTLERLYDGFDSDDFSFRCQCDILQIFSMGVALSPSPLGFMIDDKTFYLETSIYNVNNE